VTDSILTETTCLAGAGGDQIEVYVARPRIDGSQPASRGGLVLIHHMPGYDRWSKEVVRRFAVDGYDGAMPNLYSREAPGASPDDAAAVARAQGGVPDDRLVGDVGAAVEYLRALDTSNGKAGVLGHCSGGRQAVLAACNLRLDAAVDCYGAYVVGDPPEGHFMKVKGLETQLPRLRCPLLGLFGNEDTHPSPDEVADLDRRLVEHGKEHEFHAYDDAGHGFFAADRPSYRIAAAVEGYGRIGDFLACHLG
jgi:carboxymethylenebutenolidase